jgi:hypothetical protein
MSGKTRSLKIEAIGDFVYHKIKPRIRLAGYWLEHAGFKPGHRVEIHSSKTGELTLQFKDQSPAVDFGNSSEWHLAKTSDHAEMENCRTDGGGNAKLVLAKFRLGHIVITPEAQSHLTPDDVLLGIQRHQAGDWGDLDKEDKGANDRALANRTRVSSAYHAVNGIKFWLVTEPNRTTTTVSLSAVY